MAILGYNAKVSDLVKLTEALRDGGGSITRETALAAIGNPIDGVARLSAVARATKKDDVSGENARSIYEEVYGERGTIQSVARGKTYYEHFPYTGVYEKAPFNPDDIDDVKKLVERFGRVDDLTKAAFSAESSSRYLVKHYKYVYGSIAPTVGCLCAYIKELGITQLTTDRGISSVANEIVNRMREKREKTS